MRITNQMMINSSMANIQVNKKQVNTLDTQLSTQKKINKPSEDPIIAIRALRLRASLNEVTQYLKKNIPDAQQWLSTTQGALTQGESVINKLYEYCNQGSSDSYASEQRNTIAESLKALKKTFYDEGIKSAADFKNWTEKELLALKGIGPATIKKLKENGIKFK